MSKARKHVASLSLKSELRMKYHQLKKVLLRLKAFVYFTEGSMQSVSVRTRLDLETIIRLFRPTSANFEYNHNPLQITLTIF